MSRLASVWFAVAITVAMGCGQDSPSDGAADASVDARTRQDVSQQADEDAAEDPTTIDDLNTDTPAADASDTDATGTPDTSDADDAVVVPDSTEADTGDPDATVDTSPDLPPATDDCEPLGIPEQWLGSFEGDIDSNVSDIGSYRFGGPVSGEVSFEIRCINEKLVVFGELDGSADECALANGCPFTAQLNGFYDPDTRLMEGEILNGSIDFILVKVFAEGDFSGTVSDAPSITGVWSGEKTGIEPTTFSWVEASGDGTWTADPAEL